VASEDGVKQIVAMQMDEVMKFITIPGSALNARHSSALYELIRFFSNEQNPVCSYEFTLKKSRATLSIDSASLPDPSRFDELDRHVGFCRPF